MVIPKRNLTSVLLVNAGCKWQISGCRLVRIITVGKAAFLSDRLYAERHICIGGRGYLEFTDLHTAIIGSSLYTAKYCRTADGAPRCTALQTRGFASSDGGCCIDNPFSVVVYRL